MLSGAEQHKINFAGQMKQKCKILVSDPWDYENSEGENVISGQVVKRIGNRRLVFLSDTPLRFDDVIGNILVLSNRYEYKNIMNKNESLTVNGGLLTIDYGDSLDEETLTRNSKFVIIGQLRPRG